MRPGRRWRISVSGRGDLHRREFLAASAAASCVGLSGAACAQPAGETFSFLAIGDWGMKGKRSQRLVAQAMGQAATAANARFVLAAGDNFYPAGVRSADDPHWKVSFEDVYTTPSLQVPWYAALGNHDYRGKPSAQLEYARTSSRWRMPSRYYAFSQEAAPGAQIDVFVLDTSPMVVDANETFARLRNGRISVPDDTPQFAWLEERLDRSTADWKIVVGHHPIYSGGRHGNSKRLETRLAPMLERYGVQAYVCGHDHALQHIRGDRTHHICSGSGAAASQVSAGERTVYAAAVVGFAQFDLAPGAPVMRFTFKGADGATLHQADIAKSA
jgi:acid phosphatase